MVLLDLQPKSGPACSLSWKASDQGFKPGTPSTSRPSYVDLHPSCQIHLYPTIWNIPMLAYMNGCICKWAPQILTLFREICFSAAFLKLYKSIETPLGRQRLAPVIPPCHCPAAQQRLRCCSGSSAHRVAPPSARRCTSTLAVTGSHRGRLWDNGFTTNNNQQNDELVGYDGI